jgi:23S rRNA (adenine2503-C2)-methyltransferase
MRGKKISDITEISGGLKAKLCEIYEDEPIMVLVTHTSSDGTEKYLSKLADGNIIEGVMMSYKYGNTQCVSTQVGCRMNCAFCASGLGGLVRNLTSGEILSQVLVINAKLGGDGTSEGRKITNIVLMGSGEPLDNYDNTIKFLKNVSAEGGINISPRNISLSTCGLVPKIYDLANENLSVNLTISLHSPFDEERAQIMPVAKTYTIAEILKACENYFDKTGRRYIFEYSLIQGKNSTKRH